MHINAEGSSLGEYPRDRSVPKRTRGHLVKEFRDMTVLMVASWLALQLPTGIALGRFLERQQPVFAPVRARR